MKSILFLFFLIFMSVSVTAQNKIPPRISYKLEVEKPENDIISIIPEILNARINDLHAVIPVEDGLSYHNSIVIKITGSSCVFVLSNTDGELETLEYSLEDITSLEGIETVCRNVALDWEKYLDLTEPFVEDVIAEKRKDLSASAAFEESLATPFQLSLWLTPVRTAIQTETSTTIFDIFFPLIADFDWFVEDRWGLNFSFFSDFSQFMSFSSVDLGSGNSEDGRSFNIALLPGLVVTFRSLGKISGSYGFNLYWGMVRITANEDLVNTHGGSSESFLLTGETKWVSLPLLSLKSGVSWNLDQNWSVRSRMVLFLSPLVFSQDSGSFGYSPGTGASLSMIIQLGAGYRW